MNGEKGGVVELEREIAAPPDRVFRALTNPEDLLAWWTGIGGLVKVEAELRPGGRYRFEFRMKDGKTGVVHGEYRVVEPPRRLVMTWFAPDWPDMETVVAFELEAAGAAGTRLRLRHTGFTAPRSREDHEHGWIQVLALLLPWLAAAGPYLAARGGGGADTR